MKARTNRTNRTYQSAIPEETRVEYWNDNKITWLKIEGEWWALLKDICDALALRTNDVSNRLGVDMLMRVRVDVCDTVSTGVTYDPDPNSRARHTQDMLAVNEFGIYEALFASRRLEARKFRQWTFEVLKKLRRNVGLQGFEVLRMTDQDIQDEIDFILDSIYWDEEHKCLMRSVTVAGGDTDQIPFE